MGSWFGAIAAPMLVVCAAVSNAVVAVAAFLFRPFLRLSLWGTPAKPLPKPTPAPAVTAEASAAAAAAFAAAASRVSEHGGGMSSSMRLRLYALYKQATVGDAPSAPSGSEAAAHFKWRSWAELNGMGRVAAMDMYTSIATVALSGAGAAEDENEEDEDEDGVPADVVEAAMGGMAGPVMSRSCEAEFDEDEEAELHPLHAAARRNDAMNCTQLISRGAEVDATDEDGHTALHIACDMGQLEAARCLLDHGARHDAQNADGSTPLHCACACENASIAELLLAAGAGASVADADGCTPLELAPKQMAAALQLLVDGRADGGRHTR